MKKIYGLFAAVALLLALAIPQLAKAAGWPNNYQGVMLQGFYWDSYTDTKWTNITSKVDEYSKYFSLIWIPNSGYCGGAKSMGYMPIYWFTNHKSSFGNETELLTMIQTYKEKGVGFIADCVINHRNGVSNWTNFPKEEWNGQQWFIGTDGICRNDEVNNAGNPGGATGNYDTGDNFDGARDLDHTNANVQNNCKNYIKCLQEKYGYVGMRYDMVKGYSPQYTKMYNQYSNVKFSVGEYWDGYDAIVAWINGTGKTSAAFDFPFKYAVNEAFHSGDMTKLVWLAGSTQQPAGLIHFDYRPLAVTFIDNHDTYRDGSKFNGNVVAANAFMLFSPGTPCVFLAHYKAHKAEIQKLISLRNACGIHSQSEVRVLQSSRDCYMAEITGTKGKAVVKIGSAQASPSGYSNADIKASGNDYCVWSKQGGGVTPPPDDPVNPEYPDNLYIMGNLAQGSWKTNVGVKMTKSGTTYKATNVNLKADAGETHAFFTFVTALGTTGSDDEWDGVINGSDRYGAASKDEIVTSTATIRKFAEGVDASSAYSWGVAPGTYTITADLQNMKLTISNGNGSDPDPDPNPNPQLPAHFYILGEVEGNSWAPDAVVEMTKNGSTFEKVINVTGSSAAATHGYFSFCLSSASTWEDLNATGNRFAPAADTELTKGGAAAVFVPCADGNEAKAFYAALGKYKIIVDWNAKTAKLVDPNNAAVEAVEFEVLPVRWFNLQGVEIEAPTAPGIYIQVRGQKAVKVRL